MCTVDKETEKIVLKTCVQQYFSLTWHGKVGAGISPVESNITLATSGAVKNLQVSPMTKTLHESRGGGFESEMNINFVVIPVPLSIGGCPLVGLSVHRFLTQVEFLRNGLNLNKITFFGHPIS